MAEVIAFPARNEDKIVWRCGCGCISFFLLADGGAECCRCGCVQSGEDGSWRERLPETPQRVEMQPPDDITVTDLNSSAAGLRRTLERAQIGATAIVVIIQDDGGVSTWGAIENVEQSDWFDRRIETAKRMLTKG
jgi:hypothetical protein